jgi:hypothetical protein
MRTGRSGDGAHVAFTACAGSREAPPPYRSCDLQVAGSGGTGRRTVGRSVPESTAGLWPSGRELFLNEYDVEEGVQLIVSAVDVESGARRRVGTSPRVECDASGHRRG